MAISEEQTRIQMEDSSSRVRLYIKAILTICFFIVMLVVLLALFSNKDNSSLITTVLGVFIPIVGALLAAALKENHDALNSRLSQLLELTKKASLAEGKLAGPDVTNTDSRY